MKVLIIGAGRMGIRHAMGALNVKQLEEVCVSDIAETSLESAKAQLETNENCRKLKVVKNEDVKGQYEFIIIATTASNRIAICQNALSFDPLYILIEKPLGQSYIEVDEVVTFFKNKRVTVSVNLNTRMYGFIKKLKNDLNSLPQFEGIKQINYNGGSIGVGANGIHFLDLLYFLFDAQHAKLSAGEIEPTIIASGRGPKFCDFGGWSCINFFDKNEKYLGHSLLSMSSTSSVLGGWDIIGSHGRIRINELENQRVDILRSPESNLPINRYAADYFDPVISKIETPFLGDLTQQWIESIIKDKINLLPEISESLKVHKLLFQWLSFSKTHKDIFPIT